MIVRNISEGLRPARAMECRMGTTSVCLLSMIVLSSLRQVNDIYRGIVARAPDSIEHLNIHIPFAARSLKCPK